MKARHWDGDISLGAFNIEMQFIYLVIIHRVQLVKSWISWINWIDQLSFYDHLKCASWHYHVGSSLSHEKLLFNFCCRNAALSFLNLHEYKTIFVVIQTLEDLYMILVSLLNSRYMYIALFLNLIVLDIFVYYILKKVLGADDTLFETVQLWGSCQPFCWRKRCHMLNWQARWGNVFYCCYHTASNSVVNLSINIAE